MRNSGPIRALISHSPYLFKWGIDAIAQGAAITAGVFDALEIGTWETRGNLLLWPNLVAISYNTTLAHAQKKQAQSIVDSLTPYAALAFREITREAEFGFRRHGFDRGAYMMRNLESHFSIAADKNYVKKIAIEYCGNATVGVGVSYAIGYTLTKIVTNQ